MGLHSPFGYVGYDEAFLKTFIDLLDRFCRGCHTDADFGGCHNCPVGKLIYDSKGYILDVYEPVKLTEYTIVMKKVKKEIKKIEPHPCFNSEWIFQKMREGDTLLALRELLKDLEFLTDVRHSLFQIKEKRREGN